MIGEVSHECQPTPPPLAPTTTTTTTSAVLNSHNNKIQEARNAAIQVSKEIYALHACHYSMARKKRKNNGIASWKRKRTKQQNRERNNDDDDDYDEDDDDEEEEDSFGCSKYDDVQGLEDVSHENAMDRGSSRGRREKGDGYEYEHKHEHEHEYKEIHVHENREEVSKDRNYDKVSQQIIENKGLVKKEKMTLDTILEKKKGNDPIQQSSSSSPPSPSSPSSPPPKGWMRIRQIVQKTKLRKRKPSDVDYSHFVSDDPSILFTTSKKATKGASMCSFCGMIFSKPSYASYHETFCIQKGIYKMKQDSYSLDYHHRHHHRRHPITKNEEEEEDIISQMYVPCKGQIHLSIAMQRLIVMTDDALIKATRRSKSILLSQDQHNAERQLALMARDRTFYDMKTIRSLELQMYHSKRKKHRSGNKLWNKLQDKLAETYDLIKEGDDDHNENVDTYNTRKSDGEMKLDDDTLYVNVFVKQSAKLINNELERIFQQRWMIHGQKEHKNDFEALRHKTHIQALRFVKFSLSADVKPEKIAVQLSNDLCRLLPPQLKSFGVEIETAIEYRKGPFFLLGVNIITIDWIILLKHFYDKVSQRKNDWSLHMSVRSVDLDEIVKEEEVEVGNWKFVVNNLFRMTRLEIMELVLAWIYHLNWMVSVPLCAFLYHYLLKGTMHRLIVTAVTDDFFKYVEQKGMEMDLQVKHAYHQMSFMLEVLQQMKKDEQNLKKRKTEVEEGDGVIVDLRGALLGPLNEFDGKEVTSVPDNLIVPCDLEYVVFDSELPVGYRRLRKALLSSSRFIEEALFTDALNYTEIKSEPWDKHNGLIGEIMLDEDVNENDFIGAMKKTEYLMPRSVFVKANMAYEDSNLIAYNDHFFSIKRKTINPDVPYGRTFCAWTQITVYNKGCNNSRMVCSVEAEFPNGPPMVARSIKSAMRQGVSDMFLELGEAICKYASVTE